MFQNSDENILQSVIFIAILLYEIFDIFLLMYFTNEITVASGQLQYRLFESDWIEQSQFCKKCIIILSEVLKKPHLLVVLVYPLNLETFARVSLMCKELCCRCKRGCIMTSKRKLCFYIADHKQCLQHV